MIWPFNVDDVVVCVDALEHIPCKGWAPKRGNIYKISDVWVGENKTTGEVALGIELAEDPVRDTADGWPGCMFRRLPKADEQFTAQIRACRPVRESEPA